MNEEEKVMKIIRKKKKIVNKLSVALSNTLS